MCTQNGTQACPGGFHCGRNLPTEDYGVCCPGRKPTGIVNEGSVSAACRSVINQSINQSPADTPTRTRR